MIEDYVVVGTKGKLQLVARREDIEAGNTNGDAQVILEDGSRTRIEPLQRFYKFGTWDSPEVQDGRN